MTAAYRFLPWTRQGLASQVATPDSLDGTLPSRARFPVRVRVNAGSPVGVDVALYGPGDIVGVDPRGIVRTDPARHATDVEPNYLASVEFDRPDFPWMFTPAAADADERLRPWCVLVVVASSEEVRVRLDRGRPLPTVTVAVEELPPLEESWAWAHSQVVTDEDSTAAIVENLRHQPELNVSRLLCPRRLEPDTRYLACMVPAFAAGVRAGLGMPGDDELLRPAWTGTEDRVLLPVYHHWEFATGPGGDFESLARRLTPPRTPLRVGISRMSVGRADPGLPELQGDAAVVSLEGALVGPLHEFADELENLGPDWLAALTAILDAPAALVENGDPGATPVSPPLYGSWAAHTHRVPGDRPVWLRQLNLDPRFRAIAGLAAEVVRANQEELMHDAWLQVGNMSAANALLNRARFSREVAQRLHRRLFTPMDPERVFRLAAPLHDRVLVDQLSVTARLHASVVPDATADPAFRRLAARGGRVLRRATRGADDVRVRAGSSIVSRLDDGGLHATPPVVVPDAISKARALDVLGDIGEAGEVDLTPIGGKRTVDARILQAVRTTSGKVSKVPEPGKVALRGDLASTGVVLKRRIRPLTEAPEGGGVIARGGSSVQDRPVKQKAVLSRLTGAVKAHVATLTDERVTPARPPLGLDGVRTRVVAATDPRTVVPARVSSMIRIAEPDTTGGGDIVTLAPDLGGLRGAPRLRRPLYEPLASHAPERLLPGVGEIPANTVALLKTNPRFVEAFLVGANTEFAGELVWREYPARRDGTPMRHFWDRPGGAADIPELHRFDPTRGLGHEAAAGGDGDVVLLVRGDLLRRYPNTAIYLVRATADGRLGTAPTDHREPTLRGRIDPDVTFIGFALGISEVLADPGFFIVIQQQPTEPRFGFDVPVAGEDPPATWRDATWGHVGVEPGGHLTVDADVTLPADPGGTTFLANGAHLAAIALQQPVRVAIHARDLLGTEVE